MQALCHPVLFNWPVNILFRMAERKEFGMEKLKVGVIGGTGMVGQRYVTLIANHPWFELAAIAASARSAGKTYEEAVGAKWALDDPMP